MLIQTPKRFVWISTMTEQVDSTPKLGTVDKYLNSSSFIYGYKLGEISNITQIKRISYIVVCKQQNGHEYLNI